MQYEYNNQKTQEIINIYISSLENYTDDTFLMKPDEESWSIGEMYEHICRATTLFLQQTENCLKEENGQLNGDKTSLGENFYKFGGYPSIKMKVPLIYQTGKAYIVKTRSEYAEIFAEFGEIMAGKFEKVTNNNGNYKIEHIICGFLNAYEWFSMVTYHLKHHLKQKTSLEIFIGLIENKSK